MLLPPLPFWGQPGKKTSVAFSIYFLQLQCTLSGIREGSSYYVKGEQGVFSIGAPSIFWHARTYPVDSAAQGYPAVPSLPQPHRRARCMPQLPPKPVQPGTVASKHMTFPCLFPSHQDSGVRHCTGVCLVSIPMFCFPNPHQGAQPSPLGLYPSRLASPRVVQQDVLARGCSSLWMPLWF